jgi:ATP-dependent RNA helicase DDX60
MDYPEIYNTNLSWHIMPDTTEYIKILQEQGVSNFSPIAFYKEANKDRVIEDQDIKLTKKERKKTKISKAGKQMIEDNIKRKEMELKQGEELRLVQHMKDITDLDNLSLRIKDMRTNYGKVKLKANLLQYFLNEKYNTASHIVFYSLQNDVTDDEELQNYINPIILKYKQRFETYDMHSLQMKNLSSYLPPLDPLYSGNMKLDDWQLDVFKKIEQKKNILICAPTSAGKTVVSSYCAVLGNKTIFVVPSDELARQVAGIFRNISDMVVKVVTNKEYFTDGDYKVLVGTPVKLEEYLTLNGFSEFTYAIFDEWHMLNSEEGASYEKLFKLLKCPFLALSATLESPTRIKTWMEEVKQEEVILIEYKKRFIVQQRYLWNDNELIHLHPLSCIDTAYLKGDEFNKNDLSFTPRDSFDLYEKIKDKCGKEEVQHLHPRVILNKNKWDQITLTETIQVEKELKTYLQNLANTDEELASKILDEYKIEEINTDFDLIKLIKILLKKNMCPAIFFKISPIRCLQIFKMIVKKLEDNQNEKFPHHNEDLTFRQQFYTKLVDDVKTTREKTKLPQGADAESFFKDQEDRIERLVLDELKLKYTSMIQKRIKRIKESKIEDKKIKYYELYYNKELDEINNLSRLFPVDKDRPHPEFCFNNMGVDSYEMRKIKRELRSTLGHYIDYNHPFLIGIERGIIPYFKDMEVPFQRIAQSLFSQKKIPIVISDESLGYGINLPIKTVVMLGEVTTEILNPTIASQMSGRSGRRGIDREGNIIYVGVNWKNILKGQYELLTGKNPIDKSLPLPFYFNKFNRDDIMRLFNKTLNDYTYNNEYNPNNTSRQILASIKNDKPNYCRKPQYAMLIWSCRNFGQNSFYLPHVINSILQADQYQVFEVFACMFDVEDDHTTLDYNHPIYNMFNSDNRPQLCNGEYLLSVFKKKTLNESQDIKRLKTIANLISVLHTNLLSMTVDNKKPFINMLETLFSSLKILIKKHLF